MGATDDGESDASLMEASPNTTTGGYRPLQSPQQKQHGNNDLKMNQGIYHRRAIVSKFLI